MESVRAEGRIVKPVPSEGTIGTTSKGSAHLPGNGFAGFSGSWRLGSAGRCAGLWKAL